MTTMTPEPPDEPWTEAVYETVSATVEMSDEPEYEDPASSDDDQ